MLSWMPGNQFRNWPDASLDCSDLYEDGASLRVVRSMWIRRTSGTYLPTWLAYALLVRRWCKSYSKHSVCVENRPPQRLCLYIPAYTELCLHIRASTMKPVAKAVSCQFSSRPLTPLPTALAALLLLCSLCSVRNAQASVPQPVFARLSFRR
ncbi:hypothetical protein P171DRAFT_6408 [Karstenula rhodostoma CBS 690.94]|uniref:Uncharacterized protein n=1 Tax=Karstenula rhodostoma CBS 690.94 TaxID=1392251 RepID=A0A9P4PY57_9PLEO|nr:hypothetical protein P171DRAFT_6408 [Karstenula rhodostoma CBS 690.94]